MGTISPSIPTVGEPNSTEDPKVRSALIDIRDEINGQLDNDNIAAAAGISGTKLADNTVTGAKISATANIDGTKLTDTTIPSSKLNLTTNAVSLGAQHTVNGSESSAFLTSGTLAAGLYLVTASLQVIGNTASPSPRITLRLKDGGTTLCTRQVRLMADGSVAPYVEVTLLALATRAGSGTFTVTSEGGTALSGTVEVGSNLVSVRLG